MIDPVVLSAATTYADAHDPASFLELLEIDAFTAGVEWARNHPQEGK